MSRGERGFTLIELLVALAVFALAAMALLRLQGMTTRTAAAVSDRTVGQIVVRNLAVELLTEARAPSVGSASGTVVNGGRSWRWSREVRRTDDPEIVRIDLAVATPEGRPAGRLTLARPI